MMGDCLWLQNAFLFSHSVPSWQYYIIDFHERWFFVWWPHMRGNLKRDEPQKGGRYPFGISNQQLFDVNTM